jgi:cysteine-rich repeat protein
MQTVSRRGLIVLAIASLVAIPAIAQESEAPIDIMSSIERVQDGAVSPLQLGESKYINRPINLGPASPPGDGVSPQGIGVGDGGFELGGLLTTGAPNPFWTELGTIDLGGGVLFTPICNPAACGNDLATEGSHYAWFGGIPLLQGELNLQALEQTFTIPASATTLQFNLWRQACDSNVDQLAVFLDGVPALAYPCDTTTAGYEQQTLDLTTFPCAGGQCNDDGDHTLTIFGQMTSAAGGNSNYFIDQVAVTSPGLCGNSSPDPGEQCDDGNTDPGDGCSDLCLIEAGWECTDAIAEITEGSLLEDPSLELGGLQAGGVPNPFWAETGGIFNPICNPEFCSGGTPLAFDQEHWAWFGGITGGIQVQTIEQTAVITADATTMTFWIWVAVCDNLDDDVTVQIDGTEVFSLGACVATPSYVEYTVDLATAPGGPYNDGAAHTFLISGTTNGTNAGLTNMFTDLLEILVPLETPIPPVPSACNLQCGNGAIDADNNEECDDGNTADGDGCSSACTVEEGFLCLGEPSDCFTAENCQVDDFEDGEPPIDGTPSGLPADWTTFALEGGGFTALDWGTTTDGWCWSGNTGGPPADNVTGGAGVAACVDTDATLALLEVESYLCSPAYDISLASGPGLTFLYNYQVFTTEDDIFEVLVGEDPPSVASIPGYTSVFAVNEDSGGFADLPGVVGVADLGAFSGSTGVHVCFRYKGNYDWYAQVDDVTVIASSCEGGPTDPPCPDDPDPQSQGYWHRQCLGVPEADGGIDPGRNGRGPSSPTEPGFSPDMMDCGDARLEDLGIYVSTCDGMDADPANDMCEKAIKQLTALILNVCSERVSNLCEVDVANHGCSATTVGGLIDETAALINGGDCLAAKSCLVTVNEGNGILSDDPVAPENAVETKSKPRNLGVSLKGR